MCTVTYLPTSEGYLLTSSRDESTRRASAIFPIYKRWDEVTLLMPQDPEGGGSWIATDNQGRTVCLLNGAFENHRRQPPYRKSRGLILLDSFQFSEVEKFVQDYPFEGIEPFTLVWVGQMSPPLLYQLLWDGEKVHDEKLPGSQPRLWSSVTLYDQMMRQKRTAWFQQWLAQEPDFTTENIMNFHIHKGEGNPAIDFKMKREDALQTMSLSCVEVEQKTSRFIYQDFLFNTIKDEVLAHSA